MEVCSLEPYEIFFIVIGLGFCLVAVVLGLAAVLFEPDYLDIYEPPNVNKLKRVNNARPFENDASNKQTRGTDENSRIRTEVK